MNLGGGQYELGTSMRQELAFKDDNDDALLIFPCCCCCSIAAAAVQLLPLEIPSLFSHSFVYHKETDEAQIWSGLLRFLRLGEIGRMQETGRSNRPLIMRLQDGSECRRPQ